VIDDSGVVYNALDLFAQSRMNGLWQAEARLGHVAGEDGQPPSRGDAIEMPPQRWIRSVRHAEPFERGRIV